MAEEEGTGMRILQVAFIICEVVLDHLVAKYTGLWRLRRNVKMPTQILDTAAIHRRRRWFSPQLVEWHKAAIVAVRAAIQNTLYIC